ncbi:MAG: hypothetical protein LJE68_01955, partial [Rhodobacter sp.]|nr:hypothetical protein [Rhodobacter sp.]
FALCFAICVFAIDWLLPHHETRTADLSHGLRVAFVIGSAGIMQMIRDHGRYDLSNFCLLFLAIYLALNRRLFWAGLVAAVGVLHHEAFAVFALPLVFALVAHVSAQNGESRFNRAVLLFLTPVLAAIIAVAVFGNSELAADIDLGEGARVWKRGLIEYNRGISLLHIGLLVVFWSALVSIVVWFHRANKVSAGWFFLAAMAPLLLNVLGRDHPRWFTLGFLSVIIGLGVQARVQNLRFPPLKGFMRWPVLLLCLPLGPMGAVRIFPWF